MAVALQQHIETLFIEPIINTNNLRKMLYAGKIDYKSPLRSKAWQILLGYLPPNQFEWGNEIQQKSQQYKIYIEQVLPSIVGRTDFLEKETKPIKPNVTRVMAKPKIIISDHNDSSPVYSEIKFSNAPFDSIQNDNIFAIPERSQSSVSRLPSPKRLFDKIVRPRSSSIDQRRKIETETTKMKNQIKIIDNDIPRTLIIMKIESENIVVNHRNVIKRILYCLILIDKIKYTQGMNELVSVLYYVFGLSSNYQDFEGAEVACYYCMKGLLQEYSHYFNEEEDNKEEGIMKAMDNVMNKLKEEDNELFESLRQKGIESALFLFRWMSLLLTEELPINSLILFWDRILAHLKSRQYLVCFCVSMIESLKDQLMNAEFDQVLRLLQHFPEKNFEDLDLNTKLMLKFPKKSNDTNDLQNCFVDIPQRCLSPLN